MFKKFNVKVHIKFFWKGAPGPVYNWIDVTSVSEVWVVNCMERQYGSFIQFQVGLLHSPQASSCLPRLHVLGEQRQLVARASSSRSSMQYNSVVVDCHWEASWLLWSPDTAWDAGVLCVLVCVFLSNKRSLWCLFFTNFCLGK